MRPVRHPIIRKLRVAGAIAGLIATWITASIIFEWPPAGRYYIGQSLIHCRSNLKYIDMTKSWLAHDNNWDEGHEIPLAVLKDALNGHLPKCPGGGTYTYGKVGEHPCCSLAGTPGPVPRKKIVAFIFWNWDIPPSRPHTLAPPLPAGDNPPGGNRDPKTHP